MPLEPISTRSGTLPATLAGELASIYQDLDREVRTLGVACWARGDCCDFERCDHRLYASSVEIEFVMEKRGASHPGESSLCPFWLEGMCTERERRPLGCRTYFCDRRYKDPLESLHEKYLGRIQRAAQAHGYAWSYRPFVTAMRAQDGSPGEGPL